MDVIANRNNDFLAKFQESLNNLNTMKDTIKKKSLNKKEFNTFVINKLQEINARIKDIVEKIKKLKNDLDKLQQQVDQNNSGIQNNQAEINSLIQQRNDLSREKDMLNNRINDFVKNNEENTKKIQLQIDERENQIRQLTEQNLLLENEKNALRGELTDKNGIVTNNANEIQRLTNENKEIVERQQQ